MGPLLGQSVSQLLGSGNKSYREGDYRAAAAAYRKALEIDAEHPQAHHNLGSALYRRNDLAGAEAHFGNAAASGRDPKQVARSWYAKGVSLSRQGRTDESIEAYKKSLRIDPTNEWARENLVRALREKKKRDSEQQKRKREEKPEQGKTPPPMDRREMQRLLDALREQEKKLRQKAGRAGAGTPSQREKDW